jgi:hypothetical protein
MYTVIENQTEEKSRTYVIEGVQFHTINEFWSYLETKGTIHSYTIWEGTL